MYPYLVIIRVENGHQTNWYRTYGEAVASYIELLLHNIEDVSLSTMPEQQIKW